MIEAIELTSTRRSRGAGGGPVEKVSFDVYPGQVTALLGAPGTGKSTVLRLMVELEAGGGRTLFGGRPYRALRPAVREVGLALNPDAVHPGRTVQAHLQLYSAGGGVPKARVAEVLEVAGLSTQATVRCGRLDPGQRQRLAIAAALLGDPAALILDEPRALDSHGMSWFHALIRAYAAQGRTVLVAATDPDTLSGTADHVVVLRRDEQDGVSRVIASRSAAEVFDESRATVVQVRSPQAARLAAALESEGAALAAAGPGALQVRGLDRARIGEIAHVTGICLHELSEIGQDDDVFGLRPVPRQKELLPGLNRTTAWHSGVRVVAEEIEEAELVEAQVPAAAAREELVGALAGAATAMAEPQVQVAGVREELVGAHAATAMAEPRVSVAGVREELVGAHAATATAELQAPVVGAREELVRAQAGAGVAAAERQEAEAGEAARNGAGGRSSGSSHAEPRESVAAVEVSLPQGLAAETSQASQGIGVWPAQQRESAGAVDAEHELAQTGVWPSQGSVAEPRESAATTPADLSATHVSEAPKPFAGSWRSQGSVAHSRWSAAQPKKADTAGASSESPHRSSPFGLRRGRNKAESQPPVSPLEPPAALGQPAVPFTVATATVEPAAEASDGMTPWRAVAARASQGQQTAGQQTAGQQAPGQQAPGQQHPPVAEAAPAEQDASA
ncbi:ATP-binding cassette domain-containing protein [Catenulispora sp. NL8]|uniref:ATP-binding cassette domain-containing protein n=1 Tax=Catenulispora pinistramenti TaxID=2705254 RepID=A0ABS5KKL5_9ACTN|nr:ATP-binding cassette domain-containing protein [Catenulispora pinistramenti]MBS2546516.1 ATP-binding cassette domain-containing protein [Catenulispora pinistramenti]